MCEFGQVTVTAKLAILDMNGLYSKQLNYDTGAEIEPATSSTVVL